MIDRPERMTVAIGFDDSGIDRVGLEDPCCFLVDVRRRSDDPRDAVGAYDVDDADVAERRDGDGRESPQRLVDVERRSEHVADADEHLEAPLPGFGFRARPAVLLERLLELEPRRGRRAALRLGVLPRALHERAEGDRDETAEDEQEQSDAIDGGGDLQRPRRVDAGGLDGS